jgi:hypothetical protein
VESGPILRHLGRKNICQRPLGLRGKCYTVATVCAPLFSYKLILRNPMSRDPGIAKCNMLKLV